MCIAGDEHGYPMFRWQKSSMLSFVRYDSSETPFLRNWSYALASPQGSILVPLLFTWYVNKLLSIPYHCHLMGYDDDTRLLMQFLCYMTAWGKLPNGAAETQSINPNKTKLLVIGVLQLTKTVSPLSVTLVGKITEPVTTAKDLGVYIDNSLNYNDQINKI